MACDRCNDSHMGDCDCYDEERGRVMEALKKCPVQMAYPLARLSEEEYFKVVNACNTCPNRAPDPRVEKLVEAAWEIIKDECPFSAHMNHAARKRLYEALVEFEKGGA